MATTDQVLEALVDQLEDGWRRECPPVIDELLANCSDAISQTDLDTFRRELMLTDLEFRVRAGQLPGGKLDHGRLGKFELLEPLGSGSFGEVYRARDTQLNRELAVKIPRRDRLATEAGAERFLREARHAARLRHPGIVPVFEAGKIDGTYYLACALVEGGTLRARLNAGPVPYRQSAEIVAHVAEALDYAHREGIIHRDVKPANILFDSEDRPCLADFGLAKSAATDATLTIDGARTGTPAFMSPEQIAGDNRRVDARSDIYSLGVVLYELLTGQLPFLGRGRMLEIEVLNDEPRPPRRLDERVPIDLESICLKAMTKEPSGRYSSAGDMAADLRRYLAGEPVVARPVGRCRRAVRWCRRRPALAGLAAALIITVAAGFVGITSQWWRAERHLAEANEQRRRAVRNFDQAHHTLQEIMQFLVNSKSSARDADALRQEIADGVLTRHRTMLEQEVDDPALAGALFDARCAIASLCASTPGKRPAALDEAVLALRAFDRLSHADRAPVRTLSAAHMYSIIGQLRHEAGQLQQAVLAFEASERICADLLATDAPRVPIEELRFAMCAELCPLTGELHDPNAAIDWAERAETVLQQLCRDGSTQLVRWARLGGCYWSAAESLYRGGDAEQARRASEQALAIARRHLLDDNSSGELPAEVVAAQADHLYRAARAASRMDEPLEAIRLYQQSASFWERLLRDSPNETAYRGALAVCHHLIGNLHFDLGRYDEAEKSYREAIPIRRELCENDPSIPIYRSDLSGTLYNLAETLERLGHLDEALETYQESADHERNVVAMLPSEEKWRKRLQDRQQAIARVQAAIDREDGIAAAAVSP
jgi:eukaryotic-like serine/threonine-protein kinase